jgi:hypothetical protein
VARAIALLGCRHLTGGRVFHISANEQAIGDFFERCNEILGGTLELKSTYGWIAELKRLHRNGRTLPVVPLIEFAFSMDETSFDIYQRGRKAMPIKYDCERTQTELERAGIDTPVVDGELLERCLNTMQRRDPDLLAGPSGPLDDAGAR